MTLMRWPHARCACVGIHECMCASMPMCVCIRACMYVQLWCQFLILGALQHAHTQACMYARTLTRACMCIHICLHAYMHARTYVCARARWGQEATKLSGENRAAMHAQTKAHASTSLLACHTCMHGRPRRCDASACRRDAARCHAPRPCA